MYYLDDGVSPTSLVTGQPDPILLWHWYLGHPLLQKFQSVIYVESSFSTFGCLVRWASIVSFSSRVNNRSSSAQCFKCRPTFPKCRPAFRFQALTATTSPPSFDMAF